MQVHVSQYGSQELRPISQREVASPLPNRQTLTQQVPVTLAKEVSYSPITDHVSYNNSYNNSNIIYWFSNKYKGC